MEAKTSKTKPKNEHKEGAKSALKEAKNRQKQSKTYSTTNCKEKTKSVPLGTLFGLR